MNKKLRFILIFWLPPAFWMAFIFLGSSVPGSYMPPLGSHVDKFMHAVEYFILGYLLVRAFYNSAPGQGLKKAMIISIIIASLYAASDEWHQRFVSARTQDAFDFVADLIGINIGIFLYTKRGQNCQR